MGMLLIFCEVFVPGGILGAIGAALLTVSIVGAFLKNADQGFLLLLITMVSGVVGFWLWVKYFPRSRMGKKLILENDAGDWHGFDGRKQELLGKEGVAHSTLRPAGTAIIDDKRVDVVTRGEMLEAGTKIRVIEVEGNRIVVTSV